MSRSAHIQVTQAAPGAETSALVDRIRGIAELALRGLNLEEKLKKSEAEYLDWQEPFAVARRIWTALLENGISPKTIDPSVFEDIVIDFIGKHGVLVAEEAAIAFAHTWSRVKLPETKNFRCDSNPKKFDPVKCAHAFTLASTYRVDVGSDWSSHSVRCDAQLLATMIQNLGKINGRNCGFLSARRAGSVLGKSHVYASAVLAELVKKGVLVVIAKPPRAMMRATVYRCTENL